MLYKRILFTAAALAALAPAAHADLLIGTTPAATQAGGTGIFDVTLTDTGGTYDVAGDTFELAVDPSSGVTFTNADTSTTETYIFSGNSFDDANGLPLSTNASLPTTDLTVDDGVNTIGSFTTLTTGSVFGLGAISYSVAPGTSLGSAPVTFNAGGTSLSDENGNAIAFTANNGAIVVAPNIAAVPEASPFALLALGLLPLGLLATRARRGGAVAKGIG